MRIKAAVARTAKAPFSIETLELDSPQPTEILVRVVATGVCHTDMVVRDQHLPTPFPVVLGHEGAGVVEQVGSAVRNAAPGDHVVMTFNSCGECPSCRDQESAYCHEFFPRNFFATRPDGSTALSADGEPVHSHFFGQSSFATHALCHDRNVVRVPRDLALDSLGPLACGVQTGAGAIMNALRVTTGKSLAVFGTGSVGLSAIMAARALGSAPIVAVDTNDARLEFAREIGATHCLNPRAASVGEELTGITGYGVDFALDTTGLSAVIEQAVASLAPRGTCGILGASPMGSQLRLDEVHFMSGGRRLLGIVEGSSEPQRFIPQLLELHRSGRFPFERMLRFYAFDEINQAMSDSETGQAIKPILRMT
jgi:aryl-alcohol dehydrogenase